MNGIKVHFKLLFVTFFLVATSFQTVFAQSTTTPLIDSLKQLIPTKSDTDLVKLYGDIFWESRIISLDSSEKYARLELQQAKKIQHLKSKGQGYNDVGIIYHFTSNYDTALIYYDSSLAVRKQIDDIQGIAGLYNKIGLILFQRGQYKKFLNLQNEARNYYEAANDTQNLATTINNLAQVFYTMKNYPQAIEMYEEVIALSESINDEIGVGVARLNMGNIYADKGDTTNALRIYRASITCFDPEVHFDELGKAYHNMSTMYTMFDLKKADETIDSALYFKNKSPRKDQLHASWMVAGNVATLLGNKEKAKKYLTLSLKGIEKAKSNPERDYLYHYMARYHYEFGNIDSAYIYQRMATNAKNEVLTEQMASKLADLEKRYETEKKEQENELLKTENELKVAELDQEKTARKNNMVLGVIILLVLMGVFLMIIIWRRYQERKKLYTLEKERYKAVMDAEQTERSRIARELHDGLGQLLSTAKLNVSSLEGNVEEEDEVLVQNSMKLIDNAVNEVRSVSHNLMPGALIKLGLSSAVEQLVNDINASEQLKVKFETNIADTRLLERTEMSLYRVIQEVLNNMIRHAKASEISVQLNEMGTKLYLGIKDNGVGFDSSTIEQSKGIGWKNIFSRVALLNGTVDVTSKSGIGTAVHVNIPFERKS